MFLTSEIISRVIHSPFETLATLQNFRPVSPVRDNREQGKVEEKMVCDKTKRNKCVSFVQICRSSLYNDHFVFRKEGTLMEFNRHLSFFSSFASRTISERALDYARAEKS